MSKKKKQKKNKIEVRMLYIFEEWIVLHDLKKKNGADRLVWNRIGTTFNL